MLDACGREGACTRRARRAPSATSSRRSSSRTAPCERELHEREADGDARASARRGAQVHFERAIALSESASAAGLLRPRASAARLGVLTWIQEADIERAVVDMERGVGVLGE